MLFTFKLRRQFATLVFLSVVTLFGQTASAVQLTDFESFPADGVTDGNLTTLTVTHPEISIEIFRSTGIGFDVINSDVAGTSNRFPAALFGLQTLSPFINPMADDLFVANFSSPVSSVSIDAGDFGLDIDVVALTAYAEVDAGGTLLASNSDLYSGNLNGSGADDLPLTLSVESPGIRSVTFVGNGGTGATNSVFFDNLRVSVEPVVPAVPEPSSTLFLLVAGLGLTGLRRR